MKLARSFVCGVGAVGFFLACSADDGGTTNAGLELTVATDGTVTPDRVSVKVSSPSTVFYESELALGTTPLPRTVKIAATGTASVAVQAWRGSTPLDRRDLTIAALPAGAFAPYTVVLSQRCTPHVHSAADGAIASDCAAGTTCDPSSGACGSGNVTAQAPDGGAGPCTPGAARCSSDALSLETCTADGARWAAGASCNGKTCASGACTTCNVGDSSCSGTGPCHAGDVRCAGTNSADVQKCDASGAWSTVVTCPFLCTAGKCTGECLPGHLACCEDEVVAGQPVRSCMQPLRGCVGGPGCGEGHPLAIYLATCDAAGHFQSTLDCFDHGGVVGGGPGHETNYASCGSCETTGAFSCLNAGTDSCLQ